MKRAEPTVRERLGERIGAFGAPLVGAIAHARHARVFHPEGIVVGGEVEPIDDDPIGRALAGPVIARWSGALWRRAERLDVLGLALRIRRPGRRLDERPADDDQDLLLATVRSPFTLGLAPLTTRAGDFLANRYYGVSPFALASDHWKLRATPVDGAVGGAVSRADRLTAALAQGKADLWLEARPTFAPGYRCVARIRLEQVLPLDQQALRFDPFHDGRGLVPIGLVHAIRRRAYAASRRGAAG